VLLVFVWLVCGWCVHVFALKKARSLKKILIVFLWKKRKKQTIIS